MADPGHHPTGSSTVAVTAAKVRTGDRLILDGYLREVVRIQTEAVTGDQIHLRISFLNGGAINVPHTHPLEIAARTG